MIFIPGNHDDFFRHFFGYQFGEVHIESHAVHETADGRRFLVLHGDEFDSVVRYHPWLARLGGWAYHYLIILNRLVNAIRRWFGRPYWSFSGAVKRKVKRAVKYVNRFEDVLHREAVRQNVDGIICGHIHQPAMEQLDGVTYCNAGDWVENCTALVEHQSGKLEIIWWRDELEKRADQLDESSTWPPIGVDRFPGKLRRRRRIPAPAPSHDPEPEFEPVLVP